ncbi:telomere repeats-binding bouquet formation protein 2 isoform X2 [Phalacrocorax carbo]|uniref:telomere repeats-binding bouquet formation protein 2 isoform X2 n=1 Tax=Phalacrocorax carbo TaxID=9209 RepID=UPI003119E4EF
MDGCTRRCLNDPASGRPARRHPASPPPTAPQIPPRRPRGLLLLLLLLQLLFRRHVSRPPRLVLRKRQPGPTGAVGIHQSLDYLEGRATVFHSYYLSVWASTSVGAKPSVGLGHFVLPPACLQEEIRRKIGSFIWEQVDESLAEQPSENLMDKLEAARKGCEEEAEDTLDLAESEEEGSREPAQGEFPYRALQEYPMNNMVTGYTSARDMKKYAGELCDFIPGTLGYTAYWIQNEINIFSNMKTKMKKKF